jgi:hypothetical protein
VPQTHVYNFKAACPERIALAMAFAEDLPVGYTYRLCGKEIKLAGGKLVQSVDEP